MYVIPHETSLVWDDLDPMIKSNNLNKKYRSFFVDLCFKSLHPDVIAKVDATAPAGSF